MVKFVLVGSKNTTTSAPSIMRSIEMFSGAGGLALATHLAGFHHEGLFEWNKDACQTLVSNSNRCSIPGVSKWASLLIEGDVSDQSFDKYDGIDLVAGGPPCQPFSLGGKHSGMDDRRDMIPQFIRCIRQARPKAFLMENVKGLTRKSFATYLKYSTLQMQFPEIVIKNNETWIEHLERIEKHSNSKRSSDTLEYSVSAQVLNAANFGVPQSRERLFIVGFRTDINATWIFPEPTHSLDRLIYDQVISGEYWKRTGVQPQDLPKTYRSRAAMIARHDPLPQCPWRSVRETLMDMPAPFVGFDSDGTVHNHKLQLGARPYPGHTGSLLDFPSKTLKAGDHGVPGGENMIDFGDGTYRYLTVREAARLQTFPDMWLFQGAWSEAMRQLGNAVPVELAHCVAKSIRQALEKASQ